MTKRRLPRWSEVAPFLQFGAASLGPRARLREAATVADIRELARRRVPRSVFDYVDGAAEQEISIARSHAAFARVEFRPAVLHDVSATDTSTTILGRRAEMPVILAPTGFTRMMHHRGESAVVAAAARAGVPYALSTMGTTSPEELAAVAPNADRWFQLYLWRDRAASEAMIARAKEAGCRVLVLTVDTPVAGNRLRDVRHGLTIPPTLTPKTFFEMSTHPAWWLNLLTTEPLTFASLTSSDGTFASMIDRVFDPSVTMEDLSWLRGKWDGPIVVKGIQTARDARAVASEGADGIVLSNHGGRQLDRAATPLEELSEVVDAVGDQLEIFIDGGVMTGADVVASVGLGATAVLIGRAYLYGLMAGGESGVERVLEVMGSEMRRTMQLLGTAVLPERGSGYVRLRA